MCNLKGKKVSEYFKETIYHVISCNYKITMINWNFLIFYSLLVILKQRKLCCCCFLFCSGWYNLFLLGSLFLCKFSFKWDKNQSGRFFVLQNKNINYQESLDRMEFRVLYTSINDKYSITFFLGHNWHLNDNKNHHRNKTYGLHVDLMIDLGVSCPRSFLIHL